ncbi:heme ABC transporter ATP-binding protein [Neisseria sp. Ec49-e6-T10]|uniref:heme ABC transporter ATP-binding protein n=1 Tax=Neisseria sp. Ec49-e6-T10 TaxID=3140744 RepID=UPI003EBC1694
MLAFEQVSISYGTKPIIHSLSLNLSAGQCIGLLGANGAGKSTLLKAISQEIHYKGAIQWQAQNLKSFADDKRAKTMGFLPQHSGLSFAFTAYEVVMLGRMMHSTSNQRNREIVEDIMAKFDVLRLAKQSYLQLSGGEKQRVHAARVLAQLVDEDLKQAKILLLDEPTSALDLKHQHQLLSMAQQYAQKGHLVLVTLHDLNLAARYCTQLLLLSNGQLIANGTAQDVLTIEHIQAAYDYTASISCQDNGHIIVS